jgi:hypothetical protein
VLRAHAAGVVPGFVRISTERVERGPNADSYDERGSEAMRRALWNSVEAEVASAERAAREVMAPQTLPLERVAAELEEAGQLSGGRLIDTLLAAGVREAVR